MTGVDCGFHTKYAYNFIDATKFWVVGLKGKDADKVRRDGIDTHSYKVAKERTNLFLVEVNQIKDELSERMKLVWSDGEDYGQPVDFMNFPTPADGLYTYRNFFSHFEAEHRVTDKDKQGQAVGARWIKRNSAVQNHLWDCHIYNMLLKDLVKDMLCRESGLKYFDWRTYCDLVLHR